MRLTLNGSSWTFETVIGPNLNCPVMPSAESRWWAGGRASAAPSSRYYGMGMSGTASVVRLSREAQVDGGKDQVSGMIIDADWKSSGSGES